MTIILFDIDGTLAESGKVLDKKMIDIIIKLYHNGHILGIVGGGTYKKIKKQLHIILHYFKYIFTESGSVIYVDSMKVKQKNILKNCNKKVLNKLIKKSLYYISKMPIKYGGNQIDLRHGMIYISCPGIKASDKVRNYFIKKDIKLNLRNNLITNLKKYDKNDEFNIHIGGNVGISIQPKGWNKLDAIFYLQEIKVEDDIYYFGDKYEPTGNDYPVINYLGDKGIKVNNYLETIDKLVDIFKL